MDGETKMEMMNSFKQFQQKSEVEFKKNKHPKFLVKCLACEGKQQDVEVYCSPSIIKSRVVFPMCLNCRDDYCDDDSSESSLLFWTKILKRNESQIVGWNIDWKDRDCLEEAVRKLHALQCFYANQYLEIELQREVLD